MAICLINNNVIVNNVYTGQKHLERRGLKSRILSKFSAETEKTLIMATFFYKNLRSGLTTESFLAFYDFEYSRLLKQLQEISSTVFTIH